MVIKWREVVIEDKKMKDYLICYSDENTEKLHNHENALKEALKRLKKDNVKRIIIEKGEI